MRPFLEIAFTGVTSLLLHPLRSAVSFSALIVLLVPYLVGLALAEGLKADAEAAARAGADLSVSGTQFGRPAPVPLAVLPALRQVEGVADVRPRIVGDVVLGRERVRAVLVGMPPASLPAYSPCIEGELPRNGRLVELVVGAALARRLGLKVGDTLLPFYTNRKGDRLARVVGVFRPDAPLRQANVVLTTFDAAAYVFDQEGAATDLLVWCRPDGEAAAARTIERGLPLRGTSGEEVARLRVTVREELLASLPRGARQREGVFNLHYVAAFAVGILVLLVTSGAGLSERRREVGILKATGWQTDEVLLRAFAEGVALALAAAASSVLLAWLWLRAGNGYGVAALFLDGADVDGVRLPFRMTPVPALLGFTLALVLVLSGTLYSSWRAATAPPRDAMR